MNDLTAAAKLNLPEQPKLANKVRFVTAASLFDGHDASINIMRRILQSNGVEVIHLGHNRSVDEVVTAALAEDVQGIAISSYQGGHVEYFKYMIDLLRAARRRPHQGVRRRRRRDRRRRNRRTACLRRDPHLQPGRRPAHGPGRHDPVDDPGLRHRPVAPTPRPRSTPLQSGDMAARHRPLAQLITALENGKAAPELRKQIARRGRRACRCRRWASPAPAAPANPR